MKIDLLFRHLFIDELSKVLIRFSKESWPSALIVVKRPFLRQGNKRKILPHLLVSLRNCLSRFFFGKASHFYWLLLFQGQSPLKGRLRAACPERSRREARDFLASQESLIKPQNLIQSPFGGFRGLV